MYNFDFLNSLDEENVVVVFHNEKANINENIVSKIKDNYRNTLSKKYLDRNINESFLALSYPFEDSNDTKFNFFFDSPTSVSIMYKDFKGLFVIDCSKYSSIKGRMFENLISFIDDNNSNDYKFILLLNSAVKLDFNNKYDKYYGVGLEIDSATVKQIIKDNLDTKTFDYVMNEYETNMSFRQLSISQFKNCVEGISEGNNELNKIVASAIESNINKERKIGF